MFHIQSQEVPDPHSSSTQVDDAEGDADSNSSKNGKRFGSSTLGLDSSKTGQGIPEGIAKRRRTSNSDDVDIENPESSSDKCSEKGDANDNVEKRSVFGPLIKVAASMNPQQFELPPELVEPITFPGKISSFLWLL